MLSFYYALSHFCLFDWLVLLFVSVLFVGLLLHFILCHFSACVSLVYSLQRSLQFCFFFFFSIKSLSLYIYIIKPMWEIRKKKCISYRNLIWMIKGKCKCRGFLDGCVHRLYYTFLFSAQPSHWPCSPFPPWRDSY